jgi:hypothetical protein
MPSNFSANRRSMTVPAEHKLSRSRPMRSLASVAAVNVATILSGTIPADRAGGLLPGAPPLRRPGRRRRGADRLEVLVDLGRGRYALGVILLGAPRTRQTYLAPAIRFLEELALIASAALETAYLHHQQVILERDRERLAGAGVPPCGASSIAAYADSKCSRVGPCIVRARALVQR